MSVDSKRLKLSAGTLLNADKRTVLQAKVPRIGRSVVLAWRVTITTPSGTTEYMNLEKLSVTEHVVTIAPTNGADTKQQVYLVLPGGVLKKGAYAFSLHPISVGS